MSGERLSNYRAAAGVTYMKNDLTMSIDEYVGFSHLKVAIGARGFN